MASQLTKTGIVAKRLMSDSARYISPVSQLGKFVCFVLFLDDLNVEPVLIFVLL